MELFESCEDVVNTVLVTCNYAKLLRIGFVASLLSRERREQVGGTLLLSLFIPV